MGAEGYMSTDMKKTFPTDGAFYNYRVASGFLKALQQISYDLASTYHVIDATASLY